MKEELFSEQSIKLVGMGRQNCKDMHAWGPGIRSCFIIHYVMKGAGYLIVNHRKYHVKAGESFLTRPYTLIEYYPEEENPWEYMWVQDKYYGLCAGLYDDLRQNVVTKEEFERLHKEFQRKAQELEKAQEQQQDMIRRMLQKGVVSASRLAKFQDSLKLAEIDRHTLTSLVKRIYVFEDKRLEIEFYFRDEYRIMQEYVTALSEQESGRERSA